MTDHLAMPAAFVVQPSPPALALLLARLITRTDRTAVIALLMQTDSGLLAVLMK